jgi:CRP-like cAMP-binding protein
VLEVVAANNFIVNTFNANGEQNPLMINIRDNDEYREFALGICSKLSLKKVAKGEVICHRGDQGDEMYLILNGKVGVFIENKTSDIALQKKKAESLYGQLMETLGRQATWETVLKNVEFSNINQLVKNLKYFPKDEQLYLMTIFSYYEMANFWRKELLYLLTSERPLQYFQDKSFVYFMAATRRMGDIIGEQALLNRSPRNATLIALSDMELLTLDKNTFDIYLGSATLKQEERINFFFKIFPTLSKRSINNFQCMFQKSIKSRGDVLMRAGKVI